MANQRTILTLAVASLIIIGLAVFLLLRVIGGGSSNDSAHDADLKHTADRLLPILNKPGGKFPIRDASLPSFQAWVYNVQPIFVKETGGEKGQRFEQVLFSDPTTMPPQGVMVNRPNKTIVAIDQAVTTKVAQSGQSQYVTVDQGGKKLRVYLTRLRTPGLLQPSGSSAVLEVLQPE